MIQLHTLKPGRGSRKKHKIRGRGDASGRGSYSGRGIKGQRARSGGKRGLAYLGVRRLVLSTPKSRGFRSLYAKPATMNVGVLQEVWDATKTITPQALFEVRLIASSSAGVKILSVGTLTKKLTFEGCEVSEGARTKIEKAGGTIK